MHKIISIWKRNHANRRGVAKDKYFYKRNPPLLHKLAVHVEDLVHAETLKIRIEKSHVKRQHEAEEEAKSILAKSGRENQTSASASTSTRNIIDGKFTGHSVEAERTLPNKN